MQYREMKLTIELPFTVAAKTGVDTCLSAEQSALKDVCRWGDGRYAFPVEMIGKAVEEIVKDVARQSVLRFMKTKYGSEFVEDGNGGKCQKCYAETDKWLRGDYGGAHPRFDEIKMKIESRRSEESAE